MGASKATAAIRAELKDVRAEMKVLRHREETLDRALRMLTDKDKPASHRRRWRQEDLKSALEELVKELGPLTREEAITRLDAPGSSLSKAVLTNGRLHYGEGYLIELTEAPVVKPKKKAKKKRGYLRKAEVRRRMMLALEGSTGLTTHEIAEKTGVPYSTVTSVGRKWMKEGVLERTRKDVTDPFTWKLARENVIVPGEGVHEGRLREGS